MTLFQFLFALYPVVFVLLGLALGRGSGDGERPDDMTARHDYATRRMLEDQEAKRQEVAERLRGRYLTMAGLQLVISAGVYLIDQNLLGIGLLTVAFLALFIINHRLLLTLWDQGEKRPKQPSKPRKEIMERFAQTRAEGKAEMQSQRQRQRETPKRETKPQGERTAPTQGGVTYPTLIGYLVNLYGLHILGLGFVMLVANILVIPLMLLSFGMTKNYHKNKSGERMSPRGKEIFDTISKQCESFTGYFKVVALPCLLTAIFLGVILAGAAMTVLFTEASISLT